MLSSQIVLSLITIVCSGVVSAFVTYKLNSSRDERQFMRKKLEETNLAFTGFCRQLGTHFIQHQAIMVGHITFNDSLDMTINSSGDKERHHETLSMLLNIYFPHLNQHLDNIIKFREAGNDVISDFKGAYLAGITSSSSHNNAICNIVTQISAAEKQLKEAIKAEALKLNKSAF